MSSLAALNSSSDFSHFSYEDIAGLLRRARFDGGGLDF
jgi:hypothetical protein